MATVGKPITCRAAVVWKVNEPYVIETVEVAVPKNGEVRVKMISAGVCHSDLNYVEGMVPDYNFPSVLGHEGAGIVESVGRNVTSFKPGDTAVLTFQSYCGQCDLCKDPRTNFCQRQQLTNLQMDGTSRISCKGQQLSQLLGVSTFSEYTVVSEFNIAKVNPSANLKDLALVGCCVPTGYGAVMNVAKVPSGATCAVWGLGGVGMCVIMACKDSGASKIIGVDTNPKKFELAKELGCTEFVNPKDADDVPAKLSKMTNGGVDYCFVCIGHIPAMEQAFNSSHPHWGKTIVIGLTNMGEVLRARVWDLLYGRQITGTLYGSYKPKLAIPNLVEKVIDGQIQMNKLITHRIPLDKINKGYEMIKSGESLRTIINFDLKG